MTIRKILEDLEFDTVVTVGFGNDGIVKGDAITLVIYLDDETLDRLWDELTVVYGEDTTIEARNL